MERREGSGSVEKLREQLDPFLQELEEEEYLQRAGLKEESRVSAIYERYAPLTSPALIEEVRGLLPQVGEGEERRRLRFLLEFLVHTALNAETRELTDELRSQEASLILHAEEESFTLRSAEGLIRNEADRKKRALYEAVRLQGVRSLTPLLAESFLTAYETAQRLGFSSYPAMVEELSGMDLGFLKAQGEQLLSKTEDMYSDLLKWHLKRYLNLPLKEARRHDLARLFRAPEWDASFPAGEAFKVAQATFQRLGIDLRAFGRIVVDDEPRPNKSPRAFVAPLEIPHRVILVIRPMGGWGDYQTFLHELGHALHFGYTDPGLVVEFRRLGDNSITEAYAFLIEGLLLEEKWLARFLGLSRPKDFLRFVALYRLFLLRRYAAKLAYELILHSGEGLAGKEEAYRSLLSLATLVEYPRELYLYDVDPFFYAARYFRAWLLHASLRHLLYERFDEEWFRNDRTGPFLRELWGFGQAYTAEELLAHLGLPPLALEPLMADLARDLA